VQLKQYRPSRNNQITGCSSLSKSRKESSVNELAAIISQNEDQLRAEWMRDMGSSVQRADLISKEELEQQCRALLTAIVTGIRSSGPTDSLSAGWNSARDLLQEISASRARQGFSPSDVATFVLSLKRPIFVAIRRDLVSSPDKLFEAIWTATELLDRLALMTAEFFMSAREELISRQQQELLELSTPVVKLWDGILALPIIGTLDSARTQVVMESLLQTVVATNSKFAIIDITGVPTVDTLVAQHLLKTITAARLMGAECIISGVRPQIAQTIVHLGINLEDVVTKAKLSDAFALALQKSGRKVVRDSAAPVSPISGLFAKRGE
jgi:rsbT co-antagonist protein RsbR